MSSALGQLPGFGTGRGLTASTTSSSGGGGASKKGGFDDLDDDLDLLLGDNSDKETKRGGRQKNKVNAKSSTARSTRSDGDNFYGQMAALANEDFDSDEDAEPLTEVDSKKLADSVNLDDLDANLFGSFSRSQNQRKRQSTSQRDSSTPKPSFSLSSSVKGQRESGPKSSGVGGHDDKTKDTSSKDSSKPSGNKPSLKTSEKPKTKKSFDFDDDDLLDLLSDSGDEDLAPKKRGKPKIQIKSKSTTPTTPTSPPADHDTAGGHKDGKPITLTSTTPSVTVATDETDRPRTSRGGKLDSMDSVFSSDSTLASKSKNKFSSASSSLGTDILKLDHPSPSKPTTPTGRSSLNSTQIDFDDDEDDFLSGMGLDDSAGDVIGSSKQGLGGKQTERRGTMLDDLLGTKGSSASKLTENKSRSDRRDGVKKTDDGDGEEEEGFQFGGYMPSSAADSSNTTTLSTKSNLKLPSGRRKGSSELSDSLTTRPGSAPAPAARKSVRFADSVETSERPSSSPAVSEAARATPPSLLGARDGRRAETGAVSTDSDRSSSSKLDGGEGGKKPPLPRRVGATASAVSGKRKDEGRSEDSLSERGEDGVREELGDEGENPSDSLSGLFPSEEGTPKKSPVRGGRGRRTSQTKQAAGSFFEENQEDPSMADSIGGAEREEAPLVKKEGEGEPEKKKKVEEGKLERPMFPWQKGRQTRSDQSMGSIGATTGTSGPRLPPKGPGMSSGDHMTVSHDQTANHMTVSHDQTPDPSSQLASFQEMFLQQQKQMQEQFNLSLQSQMVGGASKTTAADDNSSKLSSAEGERLQSDVNSLRERVKELEAELQAEKSQHSDVQKKSEELERQLEAVKGERKKLEAEAKEHREKMSELESSHQKTELELTSQLEEVKMKLHRAELERTQLQYSVESGSSRHSEEIEAVQKSHDARIRSMEESLQRRETRWREEAESEASRHQEKLQQMEREKMDAVLALKKKIDGLEVSKTNEISRLQDIHRTSVDDLKREHEQDKHHLLNMHRQEVEALKAAHSHTRMLSELSQQVESSTREVSQLQAKLEHAHSARSEEQAQRAKRHQEQLKTLEERLMKQQVENSAERDRLHGLISKLEAHISQQGKAVDQERWQLQQDSSRLKTQQSVFEEERASFLRKMEDDKEQLQQAREKYLLEQRDVLAKCYEERRSLATERAELEVMKKKVQEKEQRDSQRNMQVEAELEASRNHIREEGARVSGETATLRQDTLKLKIESEAIAKERERLEALSKEVEQRSQEAESLYQSALSTREVGEQSLSEAQKMREQVEGRWRTAEQQMLELREKEKTLATERLSLARQRRRERDHFVGKDSQDGDGSLTSTESCASLQHLNRTTLPTSDSIAMTTNPTPHTTVLPRLPLHQADLSPLEPHPLLSSSAPPHPTSVLHNQTYHHPPRAPQSPTFNYSLRMPSPPPPPSSLPQKMHASAVPYHHTKSSGSGRRYSPVSSPTHSGARQPTVMMGTLGSDRSFKSEMAQIERTRNIRQLALLAEQDYQNLEEETEFLESLQNGVGHCFINSSSLMSSVKRNLTSI